MSRTVFRDVDGVPHVFAFSVPADIETAVMSVDVCALVHSTAINVRFPCMSALGK